MHPFLDLVAILLVVASVLLWPLINSFRRVPAEQDLKPLWQQRCSVGSRGFGIGVGTNIPFTRVALYSDFIIMRGVSTTVIPYQDIDEVIWKRNILIRLRGLKSSYVLYPRDPKSFVNLVESHLTLRSRGTR